MTGDRAPHCEVQTHPTRTSGAAFVNGLLASGWVAAAVLVPVTFNPWGQNLFALPKAVVLRSIVCSMLLVWLVGELWSSRSFSAGLVLERLRATPLFWPAAVFISVVTAATIFATDPSLSFWGSYERSQGAVTLVCLPVLGLIVASRLNGVSGARALFWALSLSILLPSIYAGRQVLGADPFGIVSDARSQVFGTLGRSNFLSAYAAMLLPLALSLFRLSRQSWLKVAVATIAGLELMLLVVTETRAGLLSAAASILCWVALASRHRVGRMLRRTAVQIATSGGLVLLVAGGLWFARQGGSGAARLAIWQAVLELVAKRPLLGYGPDALGLVFPRVYPPELVYYQGRGLGTDRAHNLFLDWSASLGIIGLFAGALIVFVTVQSARRGLAMEEVKTDRQWLIIGAVAALAGNSVGTLFSFDVWSTLVCTWLLTGVIVALGEAEREDRGVETEGKRRAVSRGMGSWLLRTTQSALAAVALLAAIAVLAVRPLLADFYAHRSGSRAAQQHWSEAFTAGERAISYSPVEPRFRAQLGRIHLERATRGEPDHEHDFAEAERLLEEAVALRPEDFLLWSSLANVHSAIALGLDRRHVALAEEAFRQASVLAPNHGLVYLTWGRFRLRTGDSQGATGFLRKAVELDSTDVEAWLLLADLELRVNPANALVMFRQAARYAPHEAAPFVGLGRTYWLLGQPEAAIRTLREALELDPLNPAANQLLEDFSSVHDLETEGHGGSGRG